MSNSEVLSTLAANLPLNQIVLLTIANDTTQQYWASKITQCSSCFTYLNVTVVQDTGIQGTVYIDYYAHLSDPTPLYTLPADIVTSGTEFAKTYPISEKYVKVRFELDSAPTPPGSVSIYAILRRQYVG